MASGNYFTTGSILAFMFLGIIRGSFSVVIHFAVQSYQSPSLVFLLRSPGTILLYVGFMTFLARRSHEVKGSLLQSLRNAGNLWKCGVMGLVQLAAPYLLFMYGLKILSPTVGGVFMAAAPWFTIILERLPFIQYKTSLTAVKVLAMILGFTGIIMVSVADMMLALKQTAVCHEQYSNLTISNSTAANVTNNHTFKAESTVKMICTPYSRGQVTAGLLALVGGSLMWSVSSVFWRSNKGDIHFVVAGIWNNLFGGLYALVVYAVMSHFEHTDQVNWASAGGVTSVLFLTILSGWLAAIVVDYMYKAIGPVSTNRVLCLVPLVAWIEDWMFIRKFQMKYSTSVIVTEVIGLVLVFVGLVSSNLDTEGFRSSLHTPLLDPAMGPADSQPFNDDMVPEMDDGVTSEEEIENSFQTHSATVQVSTDNAFPPLVEVK